MSHPPGTDPGSKILSHAQVDQWIARERSMGRRIGFTCGTFDLMHAGHVQYLHEAGKLCDRLLVAVNSDESVRRYKDPLRPINPADERMYVVAGLADVDVVTALEEDRPLSLLLRWKPECYIKGGDYSASSLRSAPAVEEYGGSVHVIPHGFPTSSSAMIERIEAVSKHAAPQSVLPVESRGLVLLDRDGTLIRDVPFLHDPAQVELLPGVGPGLARLQDAGFTLAIVTNQQGIGLGYYSEQDFIAVNQQIFRALSPFKISIARIYYCPHSAADQCECRKPGPAMLHRALRDFKTPPERTFLIGDHEVDMQAGTAAGVRTVFAGGSFAGECTYRARDFSDAVNWILATATKSAHPHG
jgi:rfaE bifunctional protein nucleotidyltransferase chain/domain